MYPRLGAGNLEMPKNLQAYSLFKKELGKGQPSKIENFSNQPLYTKPKEKSCSLTFTHGEGSGEQLRLSPHQSLNKVP